MRYDSVMIIPSLLTDDQNLLQNQLDLLADLQPIPPAVQIDIIDGEFVDNITVEPAVVRDLVSHELPFDIHFMAVEPTQYLEEMVGMTAIRTVIAQVEKLGRLSDWAQTAMEQQWSFGYALDLYTPSEVIAEIAAALSEEQKTSWTVLQIMGNQAGRQGEVLHPNAIDRVREAVALREQLHLSYRIAVDIGVNAETWPLLAAAGMDDGVVGSYLWQDGNAQLAHRWLQLRTIAHEA